MCVDSSRDSRMEKIMSNKQFRYIKKEEGQERGKKTLKKKKKERIKEIRKLLNHKYVVLKLVQIYTSFSSKVFKLS